MTTVTPALHRQLAQAIEAIPTVHIEAPVAGEVVADPEAFYTRLQDWAFVNYYAFVISSANDQRKRYKCYHHQVTTRNTRDIAEEDRRRPATHVREGGCKYEVYISRLRREGGQWVFNYCKNTTHNHPPAVDPFLLQPHEWRRPGHFQALAAAQYLRGSVGYATASEVLSKQDLQIGRRKFYNLHRKAESGQLTDQSEAHWIKNYVESANCLFDTLEVYEPRDDGGQDRVIKAIAWWTPEQVNLGRRFVSGFAGITDATFNLNERYMPLQIVYGVDNTLTTFPLIQAFICSESAETFRFVDSILEEHFFWDCPGMAVIVGDFAKGLTAAVAQLAAEQAKKARKASAVSAESEDEELRSPTPGPVPLDTIVVDWVAKTEDYLLVGGGDVIILQRCEWHAVEAIKKRLIRSGYRKEARDHLVDLIWKWVKSMDLKAIQKSRNMLLKELEEDEQAYLIDYYKPKESSFVRYYTSQYPNLGMNSSQRGEQGHQAFKKGLSKSVPLYRSVEKITVRLQDLGRQVDDRINRQRESLPRLVDKEVFELVIKKITHEALDLVIGVLIEAKSHLDTLAIEQRDYDFSPEAGCQLSCPLPLRYGLPCKCWLAHFYDHGVPVPLEIFHPRWLYDGPSVLTEKWVMSLSNTVTIREISRERAATERYSGHKFANRGRQVILDTAFQMAEFHQKLPAGEAHKFAAAIQSVSNTIAHRQEDKLLATKANPPRLPKPLVPPKLTYLPGRKRALTGREIAEREEIGQIHARRKAENVARLAQNANDQILATNLVERTAQDQIAAAYYDLPMSEDDIEIEKQGQASVTRDGDDDKGQESDGFIDIDNYFTDDEPQDISGYQHSSQPKSQIEPELLLSISIPSDSSSGDDDVLESSDDLPKVDNLPPPPPCARRLGKPSASSPPVSSSRSRRPTKKVESQISQDRHAAEAKAIKEAKARKRSKGIPRGKATSQLLDGLDLDEVDREPELPFRSSQ